MNEIEHPIPTHYRYITYCVWVELMSDEKRQRLIKPKPPKLVATAMKKIRPYMEDEEVRKALRDYDDLGYQDLPDWLQRELRARDLPHKKRIPTDIEKWETVSDAREHRIINKELNIQDYMDHYQGKRNYNHV
jgi:hypothetical protein